MFKRRAEQGVNLSFLDVMACGLGAVLLILIVIKFQAYTAVPSTEIERLQQQLTAAEQRVQTAQAQLDDMSAQVKQAQADGQISKARVEALQVIQQAAQQALAQQQALVAQLQQSIAAAGPAKADDPVALSGSGEEQYLLGLKVEGQRIGILIDTSASMTDEQLIQVIRRKIGSVQQKQQGPKWLRTKRVAKWLLARLPNNAQVSVISFNSSTQVLGLRAINSAKVESSMQAIVADIDALVPEHGTDLYTALKTMRSTLENLDALYIITDGLPTMVAGAPGFRETKNCKPLSGNMKTIDGDCRARIHQFSVAEAAPKVPTHIVLLPLEGDPLAPALYWNWANATGGLMISPAGSWP
ncbi:VWA domain-containing protein [Pseudoalteromonas sp. CNC9-20]|uniref:vWA domain-containing protein n=1 Tax=Pseudoalteromonas sp. CNC9-20 TaxID=2917750 RepID=UPI001EF4B2AC|nr:vWA domain-containing protein [Pseudoalteromonas sp. CNC9-20]MCG7571874.1 VWA domain-containing protein [Pseudoalteromonas sp. CNC9-20]